ncbi:hypothetical protein [Streptomyces mesophilus]|uniref:hypothetical protein n=1 Tax=Streptomyces mesophilus TaxID=1775132 RepID=UPI003327F0BF
MADDAPRAAAPATEPTVDTKTVNDSQVDLSQAKDLVDIDVLAELGKIAKEARGAVKDSTDNAVEVAENTNVDSNVDGDLNNKAKAGALGAMPHLGGLPIG